MHNIDHCIGCETPENERINLPENWNPGDPIPHSVTIHSSDRDPRRFVFRGDPNRGDRIYFAYAPH